MRLSKEDEWRISGMQYALDIVKKGGMDALEKERKWGVYDDTWDITIHCRNEEENKMARKILAQEPGWIPVDEKLPDPDEYLLLSFSNFTAPMVGRYTVDDDDSGTFRIGDEDETFVQNDLFVNAWMYLPKCYREEEER